MKLSPLVSRLLLWCYLGLLASISLAAYYRALPSLLFKIPFYGQLGHFILFGLPAFFAHLALNKKKILLFNYQISLALLLALTLALIDELLQLSSPNRTFDLSDLGFGFLGIFFFTWLSDRLPIKLG